jgi:predicted nucleotidyltransferase component of viral defense system
MIELLTGGGFIVDLTILSKEQTEILEVLKRSVLLNNLSIASVEDISTMKMISIIQRGLKKDFIDLWTIIRETDTYNNVTRQPTTEN